MLRSCYLVKKAASPMPSNHARARSHSGIQYHCMNSSVLLCEVDFRTGWENV
ncbi:hypothetical protein [Microseira wollei]|uniref:hypothetical protein n=1 Tax=Microseira wollei TaxID=467598 RepID=UPI001CFCF114|nr:hypothetical protein [Microseira wollei]